MKTIKEVLAESKIRTAKDLVWNKLSKKKQQKFLDQAEQLEMKHFQELAFKCVKEADEAMSDPNYISHLDCGEDDE